MMILPPTIICILSTLLIFHDHNIIAFCFFVLPFLYELLRSANCQIPKLKKVCRRFHRVPNARKKQKILFVILFFVLAFVPVPSSIVLRKEIVEKLKTNIVCSCSSCFLHGRVFPPSLYIVNLSWITAKCLMNGGGVFWLEIESK